MTKNQLQIPAFKSGLVCPMRDVSSRDSEVKRFLKWSDHVALLETAGLGIETWEELNNVYQWR